MQRANTLGEQEIPPPHPPDREQGSRTPDQIQRITRALIKLIVLATYIRIMQLLGFRIRKPRWKPANPPQRRAPNPAPAPAPKPRRQHRYIDRDLCLAALAEINAAWDAAHPTQVAPESPAQASPRAAPRCAPAAAALHPTRPTILRFGRPTPTSHSPPRSKARLHTPILARPNRCD